VRPRDGEPGALAWAVALLSLLLPWLGLGFGIAGAIGIVHGAPSGWWMLAVGIAMIAVDIAIDFAFARSRFSQSDEPDLNRRAAQLVGRVLVVEEAIDNGRGKVRVGDTLWAAEGPDAAAGAEVKVLSAQGTVLRVGPR
jgi:membrane protein implicated in regulation of membrane protease activity